MTAHGCVPRWVGAAGTLIGIAGLVACQSAERRPIDPGAVAAAFMERRSPPAGFSAGDAGFDLADGVDRREAEAVAIVFNADLRVARLRAGVTRVTAENAGLWEDPELQIDLARVVESVDEPWKLAAGIGLTLPVSGRLEAEQARAGAEHDAELARLARQEWQVRIAVREAWATWASLRARREVGEALLTRMDGLLRLVNGLEEAGEMNRIEARLFRMERMAGADEVAAAMEREHAAGSELLGLMGLSPGARLEPGGAGRLIDDLGEPPASVGDVIAGNPDVRVRMAEYEVAERALAAAVRGQYPDLRVAPGVGRDEGADEVLLGLSIPLPLWNRNRQEIAAAGAARDVAGALVQAEVERVVAAYAQRSREYESARSRLELVRSRLAPLAEAQRTDLGRVAELGELDVVVLLESLSRLHQVNERLIEAELAVFVAWSRVMAVAGPESERWGGVGDEQGREVQE